MLEKKRLLKALSGNVTHDAVGNQGSLYKAGQHVSGVVLVVRHAGQAGVEGQHNQGTEGQPHKRTEGQPNQGTEGQPNQGTEGQPHNDLTG